MKFKNVFWGLILIIIGTLLIGRNTGVIDFDWYNFVRLWPVIFILWGISVLPIREIAKVVLLVIVLTGSTWFVIDGPRSSFFHNFEYTFSDNDTDVTQYKNSQKFTVPYDTAVQNAMVSLDAAAGSFRIDEPSDDLLSFSQLNNESNSKYKYSVDTNNDQTNIRIKEDKDVVFFDGDNKHKKVDIKLNTNPVWSIYLDAGASAVDFDLRPFKVEKLDIDGGAGSFKITLGDKNPETHVKLDAGASSITLKIPQTAGCDLRLSAILSGKNINGFRKISSGHYQTDNYDTAKQKISMNVDAAVSSFTVIRY
ncbi:MAG: hypothetical protein JXR65_09785 [Bacteroidales bacterium]|nr:hypothetical protein [Bacteroidales bacterium]